MPLAGLLRRINALEHTPEGAALAEHTLWRAGVERGSIGNVLRHGESFADEYADALATAAEPLTHGRPRFQMDYFEEGGAEAIRTVGMAIDAQVRVLAECPLLKARARRGP